jgi:hypothetical protein
MNTKAIKIGLASLGMIAFLSACGKYEEGPGFTLLTKKARLTGEWDAKEYVDADGTVVADNDDATVEFVKDGTMIIRDGGTSTEGTWEFVSDKEKLRTSYSYTILGVTQTYTGETTIIRLTNKELWTKDSDGDITKMEKK